MKSSIRTISVGLLLSLACAVCGAQEKTVLVLRARKGQVVRSKQQGTLEMEFGGQKVNLAATTIEKATVLDVAPNGDITWQSITESDETMINGEKQPPEKHDNVSKWIEHSDGSLVSYHKSTGDANDTKQSARLHSASVPLFISKPVGVGDKWSVAIKANPEVGVEAAIADFEIVASEKISGSNCFKITMAFHETMSKGPIKSTSTFWIEKGSGAIIAGDQSIEGIRFGGDSTPPASGKLHMSRLEGSQTGDTKPSASAGSATAPK